MFVYNSSKKEMKRKQKLLGKEYGSWSGKTYLILSGCSDNNKSKLSTGIKDVGLNVLVCMYQLVVCMFCTVPLDVTSWEYD